jgi:hypothetical protein
MGAAAHRAAPGPVRLAGTRIAAQLGRRGAYLGVAGTTWILYGTSIITNPQYGTVRGVRVLTHIRPLSDWGWVWVICGTVAVVSALCRGPHRDLLGFCAAQLPPLLWSAAYAVAWLSGDYPHSWASTAMWLGASIRLWIVAGIPDRGRRPEDV